MYQSTVYSLQINVFTDTPVWQMEKSRQIEKWCEDNNFLQQRDQIRDDMNRL